MCFGIHFIIIQLFFASGLYKGCVAICFMKWPNGGVPAGRMPARAFFCLQNHPEKHAPCCIKKATYFRTWLLKKFML